ncbi:MAG: hypothetical protein P8168_01995 [Deltaproteobacteria bacterium]|jgi:hypothetical protein
MRFKSLAELKRPEAYEVILASLPEDIRLTGYARAKAFKISELVREVHRESYEWYGYTLGRRDTPEVISDIGLPKNDENVQEYTSIGSENIAAYQETLPPETVINGWIHSHGELDLQGFSAIDQANQQVVLDYVTSRLKQPVAKRELVIKDLAFLVEGRWQTADLARGSVSLITDVPVSAARLMETVYGGFCFAIVIGDAGWLRQEIHYKRRGILSGQTSLSQKAAEVIEEEPSGPLTQAESAALKEEVRAKIQPLRYRLAKLESV